MKTKIIQSRQTNSVYWQQMPELEFTDSNLQLKSNVIVVDTSKTFQKIKGFGGAFTEASAVALTYLSKEKKDEAMKAYFSDTGLNYNLGRLHINSCDFAKGNYSYVKENDQTLESFDISHDKELIIPFVKEALKLSNNNINLLASPWSPPAYMKTNKNMNYGGELKENYRELWAKYYVKYIQEMAKNGINIKALTVQNEPAARQTWDSCYYSEDMENEFIRDYLGPELSKNFKDSVHLYIWDHNRGDELFHRCYKILNDEKTRQYVYGIAFHWYCSEDFESLSKISSLFPDYPLLFTEGCVEYGIYGNDEKLRWDNGEHYAHHLINDFNNNSTGFIDWNLFLDETGGINHVSNFCEAPIMIDRNKKEIIYNTSYYYIGHFSKYVKQDALRVLSVVSSPSKTIEAVSFKNPNGEIVVVLLNKGWIDEVSLIIDGKQLNFTVPNRSITTFVVKKG